ncbi:hypothetical protein BDN70DRAFT_876242 [Pholiota conissans]|uniref:F-box domain-containing protein n=1 Tax=Pholiota conissans TaxID=109636 RepID=A0A9P6CV87_9AGAR|nr:hypothetical protein BDN70DRAFT_876242 [Pholiota conissans]
MQGELSLKDGVASQEENYEATEAHEASTSQYDDARGLHPGTGAFEQNLSFHLEARTLMMNSELNGFAYITNLPPEVLIQIFLLAQRDESGNMLPYCQWTRLTHVNRRWRAVALNSPGLWMELQSGNPSWAREAIIRSKRVGVIINISGKNLDYLPILRFIVMHCVPIRGLRLFNASDMKIVNTINMIIAKVPPRFEILDLEGVASAAYSHPRIDDSHVSTDIVRANYQQLRCLRLVKCFIYWDSNPLFQGAITHFTLQNPHSKPTRKQFLLILKQMPYLKYLDLDHAFSVVDWTSSSWNYTHEDSIYFAHLRVLHVHSRSSLDIEAFFHLITFPPEAIVKLTFCVKDPTSLELSSIIAAVSRSYPMHQNFGNGTHFSTLLIYQPCYIEAPVYGFKLTLSTSSIFGEKLISYDPDDANLQIDFSWLKQESSADILPINHILDTIFSGSLPLRDIRSVFFGWGLEPNDITSEKTMDTFGRLAQLDSIITSKHSSKPFLDAFDFVHPTDQSYFPKLSSICLYNTKIIKSIMMHVPNPAAVPIDLLENWLIRRYECGAEIKKLAFSDCHGLGREEDVLKEMVLGAVRRAKMK